MKQANQFLSVALVALALGAACKKADHATHEWGYEGEKGPARWGKLKPEYAACQTGTSQSPINLTGATAGAGTILPAYVPSPVNILNNGHTIQINLNGASTLTAGGRVYRLVQFHFHTPSENQIEGNASELEVHLVHKSDDGALAVIGIMFEPGAENPVLASLWDHLPAEEGPEKIVERLIIHPNGLLPADRDHYAFSGSLTTPPCSEGVAWFVMRHPLTASGAQIAAFRKLFENNARPVQPLNGRTVYTADQ